MIIDGKKIAGEIIEALTEERSSLPPKLALGVLMGAQDAAAASFVKIKERVANKLQVVVVRELIDEESTTALALRALERLSSVCAGVIIQLPLPSNIDLTVLLEALPANKDVDALTEAEVLVRPPVAEAISEVLACSDVVAMGKRAVVVGAGKLVGAPAADLLRDVGAEVSIITKNQGSLSELKDADIVVLGAGEPGFVKPQMLKEGVVLIDAGTSDVAGSVAGDADPKCAEVASVFTPVPGGIGPIAVAMIFKNLFTLTKLAQK